jgi:hypothetical protein
MSVSTIDAGGLTVTMKIIVVLAETAGSTVGTMMTMKGISIALKGESEKGKI